jgi:acyl-lipid omega-6 desaturase (Delta-12 desaturase)
MFQRVKPLTLFGSMKSLTLRLWDEKAKELVGYRRMRELRRQQKLAAQAAN